MLPGIAGMSDTGHHLQPLIEVDLVIFIPGMTLKCNIPDFSL
jgi:hypothetical protein